MKKKIKLGMLVAMLLTFLQMSAFDFGVDGIYYEVISTANLTCRVVAGNNKYKGDIVIPAEVTYKNRTLKVTEIEGGKRDGAFLQCSSLTSITIPDGVTKIGEYAFYDCSSLNSVATGNTLTEIGVSAFEGCSSLTSVSIGNSITTIGKYAFKDCTSLTSFTIPDSMTSIEYGAFSHCSSLTSIIIPDGVTKMGQSVFEYCRSLTSVTIGNSITEIRGHTFANCSSLTSVTIPYGVTKIERYAFYNCSSLTSVRMPDSVTELNYLAFFKCSALEDITLSENLTKIEYGMFNGCKSLSSLSIPGNVTEIEQNFGNAEYWDTFGGCESLKEISFMHGESMLFTGCYPSGSSDVYHSCEWKSWTENLEKVFIDREFRFDLPVPNAKELILGEHVTKLQISKRYNLESIVSYAMTPPTVSKSFTNAQYINLVVKVPNEALEAYQKDTVWGNFWNLQGFDTSGVDDVEIDSVDKTVVGRYDLNGRPVNEDYKGITIVRFSDGSTKKVVL